jgi:hypothetical protein
LQSLTENIAGTRGALDRLGIAVSSLCAIHCMLGPLIALVPVASIKLLADERTEWYFVACSITLGAVSLLPGYLRRHRRAYVLYTFGLGAASILIARFGFDTRSDLGGAITVVGALMIVAGHLMNISLCRRCCHSSKSLALFRPEDVS